MFGISITKISNNIKKKPDTVDFLVRAVPLGVLWSREKKKTSGDLTFWGFVGVRRGSVASKIKFCNTGRN